MDRLASEFSRCNLVAPISAKLSKTKGLVMAFDNLRAADAVATKLRPRDDKSFFIPIYRTFLVTPQSKGVSTKPDVPHSKSDPAVHNFRDWSEIGASCKVFGEESKHFLDNLEKLTQSPAFIHSAVEGDRACRVGRVLANFRCEGLMCMGMETQHPEWTSQCVQCGIECTTQLCPLCVHKRLVPVALIEVDDCKQNEYRDGVSFDMKTAIQHAGLRYVTLIVVMLYKCQC